MDGFPVSRRSIVRIAQSCSFYGYAKRLLEGWETLGKECASAVTGLPKPWVPVRQCVTIHDNHGSQKATDTEATVAADDAAARWSGLFRSAEPWDAPCHLRIANRGRD